MILRIIHATLCLLAFSQSTFAEDGIDPAKKAAIQELMAITGAEANRQQLTHTFTQQLITVLQANGISVNEQTTRIIRDEVKTVVDEQLENQRLQNKMYRLYARYFTLEEIEGLIAFNKSPKGTKANRVMPLLMRESMSAAQEWSEEIGPVISNRVRDRLTEQGISIKR
ncbi:MAG: DUF2059 domain-containing protein [Pseudomonadales bacterium]|nr:DUF2059 domain-containing protein [Pseudomonadales bacterium]